MIAIRLLVAALWMSSLVLVAGHAIQLLFAVLSLGCFILAAWQHTSPVWNRLVAAGLALLVASLISW